MHAHSIIVIVEKLAKFRIFFTQVYTLNFSSKAYTQDYSGLQKLCMCNPYLKWLALMVSALLCLHIPISDLIVCGVLKYTWVDLLYERQTGCYHIYCYRYGTHHTHLSERFSNVPSTPTTAVGECIELVETNTLFNCCIAPSLAAIVSRMSAQLAVRLINVLISITKLRRKLAWTVDWLTCLWPWVIKE